MPALVSIIIPTRNRRDLLLETLDSVRKQTYSNWEAIVVDDASTDDTAQCVSEISAAEPRIRYLKRTGEVAGANACRNQGVAVARGEYVIFLDSDDLLAPFCLEQRVPAMQARQQLGFAVFPCECFRTVPGDLRVPPCASTGEDDLNRFLTLDNPWQIHHVIWRQQSVKQIGPWDESLPSWQDWDFHVRALSMALPYQRLGYRDCFVRVRQQHESIGLAECRPEHLRAHRQLLGKTATLLQERGLLDKHRRRLFAELYCLLLDRLSWSDNVSMAEMLAMWRDCHEQRHTNWCEHAAGLLYLRLRHAPVLWRLRRHLWRYLTSPCAANSPLLAQCPTS
jgi:glycosyltransferase involved in cell wall biosynthesis